MGSKDFAVCTENITKKNKKKKLFMFCLEESTGGAISLPGDGDPSTDFKIP